MIIRTFTRFESLFFWGAVVLVLALSKSAICRADTFSATGSLLTARGSHTATLLSSGKVVVMGGFAASAELYDPATGTFTVTGSLDNRYEHTATLLPDGKVLVVGGNMSSALSTVSAITSAKLYDSATETVTTTGSLGIGRNGHTATLLPNGKVLVVGGFNTPQPAAAELYDPANGTFNFTGSLVRTRQDHTATLLPNGEILIVGGFNLNSGDATTSAELYDPATGTFRPTGSLSMARGSHTATLLPNGKVLVVGGLGPGATYLASAELYDPATGTFSPTGSLGSARVWHTATLLLNGKVLVTGGDSANGNTLTSAELYDPVTGNFTPTDSLAAAREQHTATLLSNGEVLVAGGFIDRPLSPTSSSHVLLDSAEIYSLSDNGDGSADWIFLLLLLGVLMVRVGKSRWRRQAC